MAELKYRSEIHVFHNIWSSDKTFVVMRKGSSMPKVFFE